MLERAVASVVAQTVPAAVLIEPDSHRTGSAATRNRALARVASDWTLFLDDDDMLMPNAVQVLTEAQAETGADVVSGAAWIPQRPGHREPVATPSPGWIAPDAVTARSSLHVSSLVRTSLARQAGGFAFRQDPGTGMLLDDYGLYVNLAEIGATFWRVPETVLIWNVHGSNTSGKPANWLRAPTGRQAECFADLLEQLFARRPAGVLKRDHESPARNRVAPADPDDVLNLPVPRVDDIFPPLAAAPQGLGVLKAINVRRPPV